MRAVCVLAALTLAAAPVPPGKVLVAANPMPPPPHRIVIPAIGVDLAVQPSAEQADVDTGNAAYVPWTSPVGGDDNAVIMGHRVSHGAPFRDLAELRAGDEVLVADDGRQFRYTVAAVFVVDQPNDCIAAATGIPMLTLGASHPQGSGRQRLVVVALLDGDPVIHGRLPSVRVPPCTAAEVRALYVGDPMTVGVMPLSPRN